MTLLTFHNDPAIKDKYLTRVRQHRGADQILQNFGYWDGVKGCAVGCTIESADDPHLAYEVEMGISQTIARLEDCIFEGLPKERAKTWPEEFLTSIQVGKDLSMVWPKFALWLLRDSRLLPISNQNKEAIIGVIALYERWVGGNKPSAQDFAWAAETAAEAAETAAWAAEATWAVRVAWAATWAARAAEAAWAAARTLMADKLLELLAEA